MAKASAVDLLPPGVREVRPFVVGGWVDIDGAARYPVVCPFTEETLAQVVHVDRRTADLALDAARAAFDSGPWPRMSALQRAIHLHRLADELQSRRLELAAMMLAELGQPAAACQGAVDYAIELWRRYADMATSYPAHQDREVDARRHARILKEPVGVVLAITPWNSPFLLSTLKLAPALAAGCTVILKPASEGPLTFHHLAEAARAAGLPNGVLAIMAADAETTARLVSDPRIDMVSFTGSTNVGRQVMAGAARNITRVALELGGKSASVVLDDADPATVVPQLVSASGLGLAGQQCTSRSRILIPESDAEAWTEAIAAALDAVVVGDPRDPLTSQGPLATSAQRDRVEGYIAAGLKEGARLVSGGGRPASLGRGWFVEPTLFADVDPGSTIAREEIFGPVLTLFPYRDLDHAVEIANGTDYGLAGSVFSTDLDRAYQVARRVRTGTFQINTTGRAIDQPFGGYRRSGFGREGGVEGLEAFLETKQIQLPVTSALPG